MAEYLEKSAVIKAIHDEIYSGGNWSGGWYERPEEEAEKNFTKRINAITPVTKAEIIQALEEIKAEIEKDIEFNKDEKGLVNLLGQGKMMAVQTIDRKIKEIKKNEN